MIMGERTLPGASDDAMAHPMIQALLQELSAKLLALACDRHSDHIDLHRLPLPPGGLQTLRDWLGRGEISATVTALGVTAIQETALAGVWWVEHSKASGEPVGSSLEISECPALLAVQQQDVASAAERLRERLSKPAPPGQG